MNKKILIPIVVVVILLLIAGGVFWWQQDKIFDYLEHRELEGVIALSKDYTIVEDSVGKFVENKKDGFKIKIPEGWNVEPGMDMGGYTSEGKVTLFSPDFIYRPPEGCLIELQISRLKQWKKGFLIESAEEVKEEINVLKTSDKKEQDNTMRKIILVDQKEALQETRILEEIGKHISIKVPTENRVYFFEILLFSEKCDQIINKFLETVSIR